MYTQFFGNYLLSKNYVNKDQLFSAIQQLSSQHMKLGTLAIHAGLMTASEVDSVVVEQTHQDKRFGELAVTMGYLTEQQVNDLLNSQSPDYLLLGQILVDDNVLTNSDLENIIADYRLSNEILDLDIKIDDQATFTKLFDNLIFNSNETFSAYGRMYMELLFNNFVRFVGEDFTPFPADICKEFPTECCVAQEVFGDYSITTYMTMDTDTAIEFASRYVGDSFDEYDEYVKASLEDFLNLHNGLFIVNCSNSDSLELSISAPTHYDNMVIDFENVTYHFPIIYSFGTVHYILEVKKICEEK